MPFQRAGPSRLMAPSVEVEASAISPANATRADQEIDAQHDLARHLEQIEMLVEDVEREMQAGVGRRRDAERAPRQNDAGVMRGCAAPA